MTKKILFYAVVIFGMLALFSPFLLSNEAVSPKCLNVELQNLEGKSFTLADFKGTPTVLVFWASWCPHWRHEMPRLKELYEGDGDIQILAVAMDKGQEALRKYLGELEPNFPIFVRNEELANCMGGVRGIPTLFVLDEDFSTAEKFVGATSNEKLKEALKNKDKESQT